MENSHNTKDIFDRIMSLPGLNRFYGLYEKKKSVLLYIFFGGLTTVVSVGSFMMAHTWLRMDALVANVISWICAVTFAYVTNRIWVFQSPVRGKAVLMEMASFFGGRLATLGMEEALLLVFVTWLHFNGLLIKVLAQFAVLILNYFISKWIVFKSKNQ